MRLPRGASASPKGTVSPFESLCPSGRDKQSFPSGCLSPVSLAVPACTCSAGGTRMRLPPGQLPSTRLASLERASGHTLRASGSVTGSFSS